MSEVRRVIAPLCEERKLSTPSGFTLLYVRAESETPVQFDAQDEFQELIDCAKIFFYLGQEIAARAERLHQSIAAERAQ